MEQHDNKPTQVTLRGKTQDINTVAAALVDLCADCASGTEAMERMGEAFELALLWWWREREANRPSGGR